MALGDVGESSPTWSPVEGVIEDATDHRLSLEQAINIIREICRDLEFAHSRDGVAKIGDFLLAGRP